MLTPPTHAHAVMDNPCAPANAVFVFTFVLSCSMAVAGFMSGQQHGATGVTAPLTSYPPPRGQQAPPFAPMHSRGMVPPSMQPPPAVFGGSSSFRLGAVPPGMPGTAAGAAATGQEEPQQEEGAAEADEDNEVGLLWHSFNHAGRPIVEDYGSVATWSKLSCTAVSKQVLYKEGNVLCRTAGSSGSSMADWVGWARSSRTLFARMC